MEEVKEDKGEGSFELIQFKPVGIVRNQAQETGWDGKQQEFNWRERAAKMRERSQAVSELIINPDLEGILDGIDGFSHLMVLYYSHLIPEERRMVMKVHPMGCEEFPLVGTFATHSPARPNSILVTVVRLLEREGNTLKVTGLDALNGSPILDIKSYQPYHEPGDIRVPDWMSSIHDTFAETCSASPEENYG